MNTKKTATINSIKEAVSKQKQTAKKQTAKTDSKKQKQTTAKKQTEAKQTAEAKKSVLDVARQFQTALQTALDSTLYNVVIDSDIDSDSHHRDDYIHVYRHSTTCVNNSAHNNVFQCYLKHNKKQVCVIANRVNFDAFNTKNATYERQIKSNSLYRYRVSYDTFIAFMSDIVAFDIDRQKQTATATAEATAEAK